MARGLLADHLGTAAPFLSAAAIATATAILQLLLIGPTPASTDDPGAIRAVLRVRGAWPATGDMVTRAQPAVPVPVLSTLGEQTTPPILGAVFAWLLSATPPAYCAVPAAAVR